MSLKQSREYRRAAEAYSSKLQMIRAGKTYDGAAIDAVLDSIEWKVANEVVSILRAIRNVEIASHQLTRIGSRSFRRPRSVSYEDLILYHCNAAVHEAGVYRYRIFRLFSLFRKEFLRTGNALGLSFVTKAKAEWASSDVLQSVRDRHVHEEAFIPPAISSLAIWEAATPTAYRRRKLTVAYKRHARLYARTWQYLAFVLDAMGEFYVDFSGMLLTPSPTQSEAEEEFERLESKLAEVSNFPKPLRQPKKVAL